MEGLRPTPDRVRETLFNWLGQTLDGRRCLDLFAGSGALGFEACSRGATHVVMVEKSRTAFRALQESIKKISCTNMVPHCEDGLEFVRREKNRYDVIFLDPPFHSDYLSKVMPLLVNLLTDEGVVYVESGELFQLGSEWQVVKQAKAGKVHYQLCRPLSITASELR